MLPTLNYTYRHRLKREGSMSILVVLPHLTISIIKLN
jgi:hypothetical protein